MIILFIDERMKAMSHKPVVKVSFNEDNEKESIYFLKRLVEKIVIDHLELTPFMKGSFLLNNKDFMDKG